MEGIEGARCGSFASIGLPSYVCAPLTAQAFEPGDTKSPSVGGNKISAFTRSFAVRMKVIARDIALPGRCEIAKHG